MRHRYFEHIWSHGAKLHYELSRIFFEDLGLREPDFCLDCAGGDLGETIGNIIDRSYKLLVKQTGRAAHTRRYQLLPLRDFGKAAARPDFSHGGREPLL